MGAVITKDGLAIVANRVKGLGTEPLYLAWGTGTTEATSSDTALETEDTTVGYARVAGVSSIVTISETDDTYQVSGSITAAAALTITEWGIFDASSSGNMLYHEVSVPGFDLAIGGILNFVIKFQISECAE